MHIRTLSFVARLVCLAIAAQESNVHALVSTQVDSLSINSKPISSLKGFSNSQHLGIQSNIRLRGGSPLFGSKPKIVKGIKKKSAIEEWWFNHPFVTRYWFLACVITTLISWDKLPINVPVSALFLYWPAVLRGGIWRLLTSFTYFGSLGHNMLMECVFMLNFSKSMEVTYQGRRAEYLWHLLINSLSLFVVNAIAGMAGLGMEQEDGSKIPGLPFLAQPLLYAIVWIWARQNPNTQMSVFGFFSVKAVYYPWFLLAYHCCMGGGLNVFYLMGFVVGHIFHFLHALNPQTKGAAFWNAPAWLERLLPPDVGGDAPPPDDKAGKDAKPGAKKAEEEDQTPAFTGKGARLGGSAPAPTGRK